VKLLVEKMVFCIVYRVSKTLFMLERDCSDPWRLKISFQESRLLWVCDAGHCGAHGRVPMDSERTS